MKQPQYHPKNTRTVRLASLLIWLLTASGLSAQTNSTKNDDAIYDLSPFVVSGQSDIGYQATQTLAGTRIKSDLADVAGAIQILNQEFLNDVAASSTEELLIYTTSTEVSGAGGNYSGTGGGEEDDGPRRSSNQITRVRGLVEADRTRDYFMTDIGFESYNTERVVINRGPNSILFGLGSPGGIINNNTKKAMFADFNELSLRYSSFESHREVLDLNQEILDDVWALRTILLNKHDGYQQKESYRDEQRIFVTSTARLTDTTTLRFNVESGEMDASQPSNLTPKRVALRWLEDGMPVNELVGQVPSTTNAQGRRIFRGWTHSRNPLFYVTDATDPNNLQFGLGHHGGSGHDMARPNTVADDTDNQLRMPSMTDDDLWFFDFRNHYLPGASNTQDYEFEAYNATLEQTFLDNSAGFEIAFDRQSYESGYMDRLNKVPYVDVNRYLVNGELNPNLGRPWLESNTAWSRTLTDRDVIRATAFYELNFNDTDSAIGKWLGRHVFTANYTRQDIETTRWGANYGDATDLATDAILEANKGTPGAFFANSWDRRAQGVVYVGEALTGMVRPTMSSVTLPDIKSYPTYMYDINAGGYVVRDVNVITRPITYGSLNLQELEAVALNLQSFILNENIVFTMGWRKDESAQFTDQNPGLTADKIVLLDTLETPKETDNAEAGEIFSWGVVGHLPKSWRQRLPGRMTLSAHYGVSENFQPLPGRLNVWNEKLASPGGDTKEYGFTVGLPDNKFMLRVNWYETNMTGLSTGGTGNIPNYERLFYNNVRTVAQGPGEANENWDQTYILPPVEMRQLYWDPVEPDPSRGGTLSVADRPNPNVTDTQDLSAKGLEIEGIFNPTANWTVSFNVAKQNAVQSNIRPAQLRYIESRTPEWEAMKDLWARSTGITVGHYAFNTIAGSIRNAAALEGAINPEIREWRVNVVTKYTIQHEGWLDGVQVGGAVRWESKAAIGFEDLPNSNIDDVSKPLFGEDDLNLDLFLSRKQMLFNGKVVWKMQLNIRNILNNDDLIPIAKDYNGSVVSLMIPNPRTFMLTNEFQF